MLNVARGFCYLPAYSLITVVGCLCTRQTHHMCLAAGLQLENVCKNAGRCENVGNSHKCHCQPGYTGSYCEDMVDECQSNPCRNGATCKDYQGTYECVVSALSA